MNRPWFSEFKLTAILLLLISFTTGFIAPVPKLPILNETIRNLYFHVPMWFAMSFMLLISLIFSIRYLRSNKEINDVAAAEATNAGMLFGILGIGTGMIWAKFTWGTYWTNDPKLNGAAVGMLIYSAYFILRGSFSDDQQRARISAIFNILAFPTFLAFIYILPRLTDSLHPGNGGNPGFNAYDRDRQMNLIFYSSNFGFIMLGIWFTSIRVRIRNIKNNLMQN